MHKIWFILLFCIVSFSCKDSVDHKSVPQINLNPIKYAKGFSIERTDSLTLIHISNPWPNSDISYTYALVQNPKEYKTRKDIDAVIAVPIKNIVVTSTTHIPSLEMLDVDHSLVGFPNLDYISSPQTRSRINDGVIKEIGKNEDLNTEVIIDLAPDVIVGFAIDGNNTALKTIEKTGIPVLYNADWTEKHPLGKAEWIKFFGALYNMEEKADSIFTEIETAYLEAKNIAKTATSSPSVLSGAMYKDIWYLPQGDSWAAKFIEDANGNYLWKDSSGTGSISANLETVLERGKSAEYWIGPGQYNSQVALGDAHEVYKLFDAYKKQNVYNFTSLKGETGGVIYYELAPNRPDVVLKDIIKILHPDLLPEHELYFFSKLN